MSKKGLLESNNRKRVLVARFSQRRSDLKKTISDRSVPLEERFMAVMKLAKLPRNSSAVRVRSRCIETGRPRAVYRFCGLSRIALRDMAVKGTLPGVRRSSW